MKAGANIGKKIPTWPSGDRTPGRGSISGVGTPKVKSGINKKGGKKGGKRGGRGY